MAAFASELGILTEDEAVGQAQQTVHEDVGALFAVRAVRTAEFDLFETAVLYSER